MTSALYIDVDTGTIRPSLTGEPLLEGPQFFQRNLVALRVAFMRRGQNITESLLSGNNKVLVALRDVPGSSSTLLAACESIAVQSGECLLALPLNTEAVQTLLSTAIYLRKSVFMEVSVTASDNSWKHTYAVTLTAINKVVYTESDSLPNVPSYVTTNEYRPELTGLTGGSGKLDGVPTVGLTNLLYLLLVDGALQGWLLAPGTNATDGASYVRPLDYNASTNAKNWVRAL